MNWFKLIHCPSAAPGWVKNGNTNRRDACTAQRVIRLPGGIIAEWYKEMRKGASLPADERGGYALNHKLYGRA